MPDSDHQQNSQFLLGFLLGALIGAATALFSDTNKGTQLRKNLVKKAKEALKDLPDLLESQAPDLTKKLTGGTPTRTETPKPTPPTPPPPPEPPETSSQKSETPTALTRVRRFFTRSRKKS
jgi:hypothetical protein